MTDQRQPAEQDDPHNENEIDDLEPTEADADDLKGGGPKNQTIQTGGGPID